MYTLIQKYMERQAAGRYSTPTCVHTDTQTHKCKHAHKHGCARIFTWTHIYHRRPGRPRAWCRDPRVHTDCPMCPGPAGHALEGACPLLPARSSALAPGRTPAPTHSSLRGPWPEAGPGPGSGGWARGGGGCRQHRAGERKRPGDLGRLGRLGPAQGCPGPRPGMRN